MTDQAASTRERILEAAEQLFAEQGIAPTTLRQITSSAAANLAAVNYHFGNKQQLVHEVFRRRLDALNQERLARLAELQAAERSPVLESVLCALIYPALAISQGSGRGGHRFIKVMARAYAENDRDLHGFLSEHYGHVIRQFASVIQQLLPQTPLNELRWQLDFVIGALTYVMADFGAHFSQSPALDSEDIAHRLVAFAAAGLSRTEAENQARNASGQPPTQRLRAGI